MCCRFMDPGTYLLFAQKQAEERKEVRLNLQVLQSTGKARPKIVQNLIVHLLAHFVKRISSGIASDELQA